MQEILESIKNGQRKQSLEQLKESAYILEDLFEVLLNHGEPEEVIRMYRVAVSQGYIKFN
jgi:hypothetical protein